MLSFDADRLVSVGKLRDAKAVMKTRLKAVKEIYNVLRKKKLLRLFVLLFLLFPILILIKVLPIEKKAKQKSTPSKKPYLYEGF